MEWTEEIRLQVPARSDSIRRVLRGELERASRTPGLVAWRLLQDINVETELTVVLEWESDRAAQHGSALAAQLLGMLAERGLAHRATLVDVSRG